MELTLEESNWLLGTISDEIRGIKDLKRYEAYKNFLIKLKEKVGKRRLND
jgi:hypothetical protein